MSTINKMLNRARHAGMMLLVGATLSACASHAPKQLPPPPSVTPPVSANTTHAPVPGSQADFEQSLMGQDTIHFALDRFNIDSASVAALQAQARWLMRYPAKHATLEGHCDERGTVEYNIALGQRRANAAKNYLVSLGIGAERLNVVSYGKARPIDPASNEEAWAKNRRAVTVTVD